MDSISSTSFEDNRAHVADLPTGSPLSFACQHDASALLCSSQPHPSHVVFSVRTAAMDMSIKERAPFELCVVLDKSGSMKGDRLNYCKEAIKLIIDNLDQRDKVSFLTYDDRVTGVFVHGDLANKEGLKGQVDAVEVGGSTNISQALIEAGEALGLVGRGRFFKTRSRPSSSSGSEEFVLCSSCKARNFAGYKFCSQCGARPVAVLGAASALAKRIFLFSDGQANQGLKALDDFAALAEEMVGAGASISTFGIGHDFNEDVMTAIARNGAGNFCFIESTKRIPEQVAEAIGGLKALVGTNARLEFQGTPQRCRVLKVYDHEGSVAKIHDLRFANLVQVVVQIETTVADPSEDVEVLSWALHYLDMASRQPVTVRGSVGARFVTDASLVKPHPEVAAVVLQLQAADMDKELLRKLDQGKREEAMKLKQQQVQMMDQAAQMAPNNASAQTKLAAAKKSAKLMEKEKDTRRVRKNVQQEGYLQRKNSFTSIQQLAGYVTIDDDDDDVNDYNAMANNNNNNKVSPPPVIHKVSRSPSPVRAVPVATPVHTDWLGEGVYSTLDTPVQPLSLKPVDLSRFKDAGAKVAVARELVDSLKEYGFAVLVNHGFSALELDGMIEQTTHLFNLPQLTKVALVQQPEPSADLLVSAPAPAEAPSKFNLLSKVRSRSPSPTSAKKKDNDVVVAPIKRSPSPTRINSAVPPPNGPPVSYMERPMMKTMRGYTEPRREALNPRIGPDIKETFDYGKSFDDSGATHLGRNVFPPNNATFQSMATMYLEHGCTCAKDLLHVIALGLGLDEAAFDQHFQRPLAIQRLIKYPPQGKSTDGMGAGSHVDFGAVTLLYQSLPGLEIMLPDGSWRSIVTPPHALILNTGFLLEKLTNGVLPATQHRVINRNNQVRYSTAFFLDPNPLAVIEPIRECGQPARQGKTYESCVSGHKGVRYHGSGYQSKPLAK